MKKLKILSYILLICMIMNLFTSITYAQENAIQTEYYVSLSGDDNNEGTLESPFKTLERARNAVRLVNSNMTGDIIVYVMGGTHVLDNTLEFVPEDSGTNGFNIIYKNYLEQVPVLSGGKTITGWAVHDAEKNIWEADAGDIETRQLYVNGTRVTRARSVGGLAGAVKTETGYTTTDTDIQNWANITDVEFVYNVVWTQSRVGIASILGSTVTMKQPGFEMNQNKAGGSLTQPTVPTYIENAYELLDSEGEWYLNRATDKIYYKPQVNEDMLNATVVAPVLETLIKGTGTIENTINNIQFQGLTFSYATWLRPNGNDGFAEIQADFCRNVNPADDWAQTPGNVQFIYAKNIKFEKNIFTRLGAGALQFGLGSQNNKISGNVIHDVSSSGVQVGGVSTLDHHPTNPAMILKNNEITNNYIYNIGAEYKGAVAIFAGYTEATLIAHNELTKLPYSGISIGWGWGGVDSIQNPSTSKNNIIRNNYIHDIMNTLMDGGGIYSLGAQPGMVISENVVSDVHNWYGSIYLDDGSRYVTVQNNIMYNNIINMLVKGSDHIVRDNYWDREKNMFALNNNVYTNNNVVAVEDFSINILKQAGLEHAYYNISPYTSLLDGTWPELDQDGNSIKEWTAQTRGYVRLADNISVTSGAIGVTAAVYKNAVAVAEPTAISEEGTPITLYHKVLKGDKLRFIVNDNANIDWTPLVNFAAEPGAADITKFDIEGQVMETTIDYQKKEIAIIVASDVDISNLIPDIEISDDCNITPDVSVARDFSQPVTYVVKDNEDIVSKTWNVIVVKQPPLSSSKGYNINNEIGDVDNWVLNGPATKSAVEGSITIGGSSAVYGGGKFQNELLEFEMKGADAGGGEWPAITIRQKLTDKDLWDPSNEGYMLGFKGDSIELQKFNAGVRTVFYGEIGGFNAIYGKLSNSVFEMGKKYLVQFGAMNTAEGVRLVVNVDGKKVIDCMDTTTNQITTEGYMGVYAYSAPVTLGSVPVVHNINNEIGDVNNWVLNGPATKNAVEGSITIGGTSAVYGGGKFQNELLEFEMKGADAGGGEWPAITIRQKLTDKDLWDPSNEGYILGFKGDSIELQKFNAGVRTVFYGEIGGFNAIYGKLSNSVFEMGKKYLVQFGAMNTAEGVRLVVNVDGKKVIDCMDTTTNQITTEGYMGVYAYSAPVTLSNVFITSRETNGLNLSSLNAAILNVRNLLDSSSIGLNWGQYPQSSADQLELVRTQAITVAADESSTQDAVDARVVALNNAKLSFQQSRITSWVTMETPIFTDENGAEVSTLISNGTINVKASIENSKAQETSATFIVVMYNAENNLVDYVTNTKAIAANAVEQFSATITLPENVDGSHLEVFTWNSLEFMEPQSNVYRFPFLPPQMENLKTWLKADAGLTLVDGKVSVWADQSGSENDFIQGTSDNMPQFVQSAAGNKPSVRFDGLNDNLTNLTINDRMDPFTIAWTIKPEVLDNYNQQMGGGGGWGAFNSHSSETGAMYIGITDSSRINAPAGTLQAGILQQFTFVYDGAMGSLYKNGTMIDSQTMVKPTLDWAGYSLGTPNAGSISGDIAEFMIYNTALTDMERQGIEQYLKNKYGY